MKTVLVTLIVTYDEAVLGMPNSWDWPTLLGVADALLVDLAEEVDTGD